MSIRRRLTLGVAGAIATWLIAEAWSWRASTFGVDRRQVSGDLAVVVLGCRNRGTRANRVNRWRVKAALRSLSPGSLSPTAASATLYFCGGGVGSAVSEAQLLADYAVNVCGYAGPYQLEAQSRTTLENIENVIPMIESADAIMIVSNPGHTLTGRRNLQRLRPDLATRLVRAEDYRFGEIGVSKVGEMAASPLLSWLRRRHHPRSQP